MAEAFTIGNGMRITWRRSARARRMTLRVPRDGGPVVLTLPAHVALADGAAFAESKSRWLLQASERRPAPSIVRHGVALPVSGSMLTLTPAAVRVAGIKGEALLLPAARRPAPVVQAFLKHLAMQHLRAACDRHAAALGRSFRAIVLRDTRSRWGSCTSDGRLMFSWRLAMAPPAVLDYVAAHEVAHLRHMDHSPRFWAAVAALMPDYARHRDWLRRHGADLMAWQFRDPAGD
ncbi:M48 family metallopeptidase [Paracoccus benzoatiresistens]|uniref:SprT family zinc-dependent metalloprotease n=1 Tax=Paracoccus benzoatiresistens TaxID=2997341 RepID=A0ABT4J3C1_9RHOB|nr:SprT family zinc-dependent metalloprotease [Paracoccus sp. EF6]MCZ0960878.1 SprT family zinc-dependent metalloprotease [Paracoccus sp. EF6]